MAVSFVPPFTGAQLIPRFSKVETISGSTAQTVKGIKHILDASTRTFIKLEKYSQSNEIAYIKQVTVREIIRLAFF